MVFNLLVGFIRFFIIADGKLRHPVGKRGPVDVEFPQVGRCAPWPSWSPETVPEKRIQGVGHGPEELNGAILAPAFGPVGPSSVQIME
jgi:hypothetical protein